MKRKTIKELENEIKELNKSVNYWIDRYSDEKLKHDTLLRWIQSKFTWWLELATKNSSPCMKYLIKDTAIILGMKNFQ